VAANVAALVARSYRVWVRDPDERVVAVASPWVDRLSDLLAEISNTTNQERSNTP
jgi:hypothetical protein